MASQADVTHTWTRQFSGRLAGEDFKLGGWLLNVPRGLGYFLPWTPLLLLLPRAHFSSDRQSRAIAGVAWGIGISFAGVSVLPGALARYTMPLLGAAAWLMAAILSAERFDAPAWLRLKKPVRIPPVLRLPAIVAAAVCLAIAIYAFAAMPFLKKRAKIRPIAAEINAAVAPDAPLYAVDPDYQPFLFYVRDPVIYVPRVADVPTTARELLVQARDEASAINSTQWEPLRARPVRSFKDYRGKRVTLLRIDGS